MAKKKKQVKQQYEIVPHEGIGPVRLGMTRKAVAKAMEGERGATVAESSGDRDYFFKDHCFRVFYSPKQKVDYIEVMSSNYREFRFEGVNVHKLSANKLLEHISQYDEVHPGGREAEDYPFFPNLILGLGERKTGPSRWDCVGVGDESYRDDCLRRLDAPFERYWPGEVAIKAEQKVVDWVWGFGGEVGIDEKRHVRRVYIPYYLIDLVDDDFKKIARLMWLEALHTQVQKGITNTAISHISGLARMKALRISATNLDDGMMNDLVKLTNLVELALPENISATGLKKLTKLRELGNLSLDLQPGAEEGLTHLKRLPNLHTLRLSGALTDKGLWYFKDYPKLRELRLSSTEVTAAGCR